MKEVEDECKSWEEFKTKIEKLIKDSPRRGGKHKNGYDHFRFRGHGDAGWKLKTSLERIKGKEQVTVSEYRRQIEGIRPEIQSFTNRTFESKDFLDKVKGGDYFSDEEYIYMTYLRQNGYPSPLLDWTDSPYIASYFAFKDKLDVSHVAIYAYQQKVEPLSFVILSVGWTIPTDKKHFLQGAEYTYCVVDTSENVFFANHEDALKKDNRCQDRLIKYTIPVSEREKALYDLSLYKINEYTLFETEESLMKKLEIDEFIILAD